MAGVQAPALLPRASCCFVGVADFIRIRTKYDPAQSEPVYLCNANHEQTHKQISAMLQIKSNTFNRTPSKETYADIGKRACGCTNAMDNEHIRTTMTWIQTSERMHDKIKTQKTAEHTKTSLHRKRATSLHIRKIQ